MLQKTGCDSKVMLVDDNEIDHFLVKHVFRLSGYKMPIKRFMNAEDALKYLSAEGCTMPELILVDINMPGMNGFDFVEAFSRMTVHTYCNIVMLSSSISETDIEKSEGNSYVRMYIEKPLTKEKLQQVLDNCMEKKSHVQ